LYKRSYKDPLQSKNIDATIK